METWRDRPSSGLGFPNFFLELPREVLVEEIFYQCSRTTLFILRFVNKFFCNLLGNNWTAINPFRSFVLHGRTSLLHWGRSLGIDIFPDNLLTEALEHGQFESALIL